MKDSPFSIKIIDKLSLLALYLIAKLYKVVISFVICLRFPLIIVVWGWYDKINFLNCNKFELLSISSVIIGSMSTSSTFFGVTAGTGLRTIVSYCGKVMIFRFKIKIKRILVMPIRRYI